MKSSILFFNEGQKVLLTTVTEIECRTSSNFMGKSLPTFRQFSQKPQKFLSNNKAIFVDFSIKKSTKSRRSSNKTKLTKPKKIKSTKSNKNKWCQNFNGLKISLIKLMLKTNRLFENMPHWKRNSKFNKKIKKSSLNNFLWRKNKMLYLKLKFNNMKNSWIKSANKCNSKKLKNGPWWLTKLRHLQRQNFPQ